MGYYEDGALRYAGKVGTGYDRATLELLHRKLAPLHRRTSPFAPGPVPAGEVQWVTPKLVVEIGFGEWTGPGCCGIRGTWASGTTRPRARFAARASGEPPASGFYCTSTVQA